MSKFLILGTLEQPCLYFLSLFYYLNIFIVRVLGDFTDRHWKDIISKMTGTLDPNLNILFKPKYSLNQNILYYLCLDHIDTFTCVSYYLCFNHNIFYLKYFNLYINISLFNLTLSQKITHANKNLYNIALPQVLEKLAWIDPETLRNKRETGLLDFISPFLERNGWPVDFLDTRFQKKSRPVVPCCPKRRVDMEFIPVVPCQKWGISLLVDIGTV